MLADTVYHVRCVLDRFPNGHYRDTLNIGFAMTFAIGWLLSRAADFSDTISGIDSRIAPHNNCVDLALEMLDMVIGF